mgnify:FL=1
MKAIKLDILTSPGCKICHSFFEFWKDESKNWPNIELKDISVVTPEGQELVQKYMIFASPGIIIDGELFQTGGFDKAKFLQKLKELS